MRATGEAYPREPLPWFAGRQTFHGAPSGDTAELEPGMLAVLGVPLECTIGRLTTLARGPAAIRVDTRGTRAAIDSRPEKSYTSIVTGIRRSLREGQPLLDLGDLELPSGRLGEAADRIERAAFGIGASGSAMLALGGDHFASSALFAGYAAGRRERGLGELGYIQVDKHLDVAAPSPRWGDQVHGCQARTIAGPAGANGSAMVWIGVGGYAATQDVAWVRSAGGTVFTAEHVRRDGLAQVVERAIEIASAGGRSVYASIDVGVIETDLSPVSGPIHEPGLSPGEMLDLASLLGESEAVCAVDVMQVSPAEDPMEMTSRLAAGVAMGYAGPRVYVYEQSRSVQA